MSVDERHGDHDGARVGALRAVDLRGDGRGVVPAHVVPHGDEQAAEQIAETAGGRGAGSGERCARARTDRSANGASKSIVSATDPSPMALAPRRFHATHAAITRSRSAMQAPRRGRRPEPLEVRGRRASGRSPCRRRSPRARATPPGNPRRARAPGAPTRSSRPRAAAPAQLADHERRRQAPHQRRQRQDAPGSRRSRASPRAPRARRARPTP